jgi:hypothetical protein
VIGSLRLEAVISAGRLKARFSPSAGAAHADDWLLHFACIEGSVSTTPKTPAVGSKGFGSKAVTLSFESEPLFALPGPFRLCVHQLRVLGFEPEQNLCIIGGK